MAICILIKYQGHGKIRHRHNADLMPALVDVCGISALTGGEGFIHEVWAGGPLGDPGVGVTPAAVPVPCTRAPGRVCGRGGTQLPLATVLGRPAAILPPVKIGFSVEAKISNVVKSCCFITMIIIIGSCVMWLKTYNFYYDSHDRGSNELVNLHRYIEK